jgi:hypothetical protein
MDGETLSAPVCRAVPELLQDLPLGKIRNFGGKLGLELQAMGCSTAGQARVLDAMEVGSEDCTAYLILIMFLKPLCLQC